MQQSQRPPHDEPQDGQKGRFLLGTCSRQHVTLLSAGVCA